MLIRLLSTGAHATPDRPLIDSPGGTLTYAQGLARAQSLAKGLSARRIDRFACWGSPIELIPLLCASTAVGSEACVYPADLDDAARGDLAGRFDHRVVISQAPGALAGVEWLSLDTLGAEAGLLPPEPQTAPALVLTTGTTGEPRGARHDWSRLAGAVTRGHEAHHARWFFAYNLNQFAGLQVLLRVLVDGSTLVVPPTNHPREALAVLRDFNVTHVSATPTFWRYLIGLLDEDVARAMAFEQITLGGEAVPGPLLDRLAALFPSARISQVYAANEFGSSVSVKDRKSGLPSSVLERGDDAEVQMRIEGGELYVRSRVGMLGYYGEEDVGDGWRPTGDLVEVRGDRLVFVGRENEIINVGGVKVHPLPIEEVVQAVEGVELVHAYGRKNPVTGQIVAIDVVARSGFDADLLEDQIREACDVLLPAARPRRIRFVDELDVKGNKVVRRGRTDV